MTSLRAFVKFLVIVVSATTSIAFAQPPATPQWQTAAAGKMEFEVASVREDPAGKYVSPPFSTDSDDNFAGATDLFVADAPVTTFISFAYKLDQQHSMLTHLPDWAKTKHFEIRARATGTPTKDQMRLMMQSLLADRFELMIHFETQVVPVLVMTLATPGKLKPGLRLHVDGPPCDVVASYSPGSTVSFDMFPCNVYMALNKTDQAVLAGARNTTVQLMAAFFSNVGHLRPIVDRTGLSGKIDFSMEYTPDKHGDLESVVNAQTELPGTTFLEAIKDQLGLNLKPDKAPLAIPVVDHIEMPSQN